MSRLVARARYAFDNSMARGTIALVGWLSLVSLAFLSGAAFVLAFGGLHPEGSAPLGLAEALWFGLMRLLDAGTVAGDSGSWVFRLFDLGITMVGIFLVSVLIGIITSGVQGRVEELRRGRSQVIETGHTVILGWTPQVFTLLQELAEANRSRGGGCVVILAEEEKTTMEEAVRERAGTLGRTRVVCRSGSPIEMGDLTMVSVQTSRAILVLPPGDEDPDATVIKTILAITNARDRRKAPYHIVAVVTDPANVEAARLVGKDEAEIILAGDVISRITVQTCRQSGLSVVHTELLDFGGDEIYFRAEPDLAGRRFGELLSLYDDASPIGLLRGRQSRLNPSMDTVLEPGDQLILVAEDEDRVSRAAGAPPVEERAIVERTAPLPQPERTLILGWNWRAPRIIAGLDDYVAPGSQVVVVAELDEDEAGIKELAGRLGNLFLDYRVGDPADRRQLDTLGVASFENVIALCSDRLDPARADNRVLMTLLHLRDIGEKVGRHIRVVTEIMDLRNRDLAEVTRADDFIVSDRLVSLLLAQISETKALAPVFEDLFDADGAEIYLKPASLYVLDEELSFATVVEAARRRGEIAIGYKLAAKASDPVAHYGVEVNPPRRSRVRLGEADRVIVLAED